MLAIHDMKPVYNIINNLQTISSRIYPSRFCVVLFSRILLSFMLPVAV